MVKIIVNNTPVEADINKQSSYCTISFMYFELIAHLEMKFDESPCFFLLTIEQMDNEYLYDSEHALSSNSYHIDDLSVINLISDSNYHPISLDLYDVNENFLIRYALNYKKSDKKSIISTQPLENNEFHESHTNEKDFGKDKSASSDLVEIFNYMKTKFTNLDSKLGNQIEFNKLILDKLEALTLAISDQKSKIVDNDQNFQKSMNDVDNYLNDDTRNLNNVEHEIALREGEEIDNIEKDEQKEEKAIFAKFNSDVLVYRPVVGIKSIPINYQNYTDSSIALHYFRSSYVNLGNSFIVTGGTHGQSIKETCYRMTQTENEVKIVRLPDMIYPRKNHATCYLKLNNQVVACSGTDSKTCEVLDLNICEKWTQLPDLNKVRQQSTLFTINDNLYIVGGSEKDNEKASLSYECMSFEKRDNWQQHYIYNEVAIYNQMGVINLGKRIIFCGGISNDYIANECIQSQVIFAEVNQNNHLLFFAQGIQSKDKDLPKCYFKETAFIKIGKQYANFNSFDGELILMSEDQKFRVFNDH